ncbi:hypothetical protein D3C87_1936210 [compost metagenome]
MRIKAFGRDQPGELKKPLVLEHQPRHLALPGVEILHQSPAEDVDVEVQIEMADKFDINHIGPDLHAGRDVGDRLFSVALDGAVRLG